MCLGRVLELLLFLHIGFMHLFTFHSKFVVIGAELGRCS